MAQGTTTIESVWAAKGNLPDNAIVATADGKYPALDGSLITNVGAGDMTAAVYDPTTIQADAFARVNHTGTQTAATISDFDVEVGNNTAVALNTAKVGITPTQASDISANNAKVGITPTQASEINTALQPADPTLDSVTSNGATTVNNITVGGKFATGNNVATGLNAIALGGAGNSATGEKTEVLGGDTSTASGVGSTIVGGSSLVVTGNWSISLGGLNGGISGSRGGMIGGFGNTLSHDDSAMIATKNKSSVAADTAHVQNLHAFGAITMPTGAADSYVLTSDASGVGTWQANEKVSSDTTGEAAGSDSVLNMVSLTQAEYDTALANFPATIKATTLYIIKP